MTTTAAAATTTTFSTRPSEAKPSVDVTRERRYSTVRIDYALTTTTLVDGRRLPVYAAVREQRRLRHQRHLITTVRTAAAQTRAQRPAQQMTRKHAVFDRGQTDRISLTHDLGLQSLVSHGHDPLMCKRSRSKVSRFKREWIQTDGRTDRGDCIT